MDVLTIVLAILFSVQLIYGLVKLVSGRRKNQNLPPGPMPLPIIGNLHSLGRHPHKSLAELAKTHGPIMFLRFGFKKIIVISTAAMAKEVLQKHDLAISSRPIPDAFYAHNYCKHSVSWLPMTSHWRTLRKVLMSNIFNDNRLHANQEVRRQKVEGLVQYCRKCSETGEAVDLRHAALKTSLNLLTSTIFCRDWEAAFANLGIELKDVVEEIIAELETLNLVDYFPLLQNFDPHGARRRMTTHIGKAFEIFNSFINERVEKKNSRVETNDVDLIDVLLASSEEIDRSHIESICLDLFIAGIDTTPTALEWAMTEVMRNPETMKRAKAELDEVIGTRKMLEEDDLARLPYLRGMVKETLRLHPVVPLVPRLVEQDLDISGYTVPKNSQVFVSAWAIGRDASTWTDPLEFKPERFLDCDVGVRGGDFTLIPFGVGRRICPGMHLALRVVPLMLGSLLNSFDWKIADGIDPQELDMSDKSGVTLQKAHPLRLIPIPI